MVNRRDVLGATLAGTVLTSALSAAYGASASSAATYDLVIKGGRVIDPASGLNEVRDVAIAGGRIAAVEKSIVSRTAEILDVTGKLVVPGLIDIHTHAARNAGDAQVILQDGVTCFVDAGSAGAQIIEPVIANLKAAPNNGKLLINVSRLGVTAEGELRDIKDADVEAAQATIAKYPEFIIGVKARLSFNVAGRNDLEALKRAQEIAGKLPVMIHMGQTVSPMAKILALLKSGDVVTHMYSPEPNSIFDGQGRILPEVLDARRRGVIFDVGNGRSGHLWWDVAEKGVKQKFLPTTISTDWTQPGRTNQVIDIENCMSRFLLLGVPMTQVVADVTSRAAKVFTPFHDRGTLRVGAVADVAIMELREGNFNFDDNYGVIRSGKHRLFPYASVLAGKKVQAKS